MRLVPLDPGKAEARSGSGLPEERLKGFEPSTFCMASRRSSQLSYSRKAAEYSRDAWADRSRGNPFAG
jgi:hypothetical protein